MNAPTVSRRAFLLTGAAAGTGLVIGAYLPWLDRRGSAARATAPFQPNVWIRIDSDGAVTLWCARSEMGQGVRTAMPMIVAEELEVEWSAVQVRQADGDPAYGNQFTTGSRSVTSGWEPLRKAGAAAREMLIDAAAQQWGVPRTACRARAGAVEHPASDRRLGYGALASAAAALPVPSDPPLKNPSDFRIVGTRIPRLDTVAKVTGRATYGIDIRRPGMRYAAIARCPVFGGTLTSFDPAPALAVPGVRQVVRIETGVAVVADNSWAAFRGRDALVCEWEEGPTAQWSTDGISRAFAAALANDGGEAVRNDGDAPAALRRMNRVIEATYEAPFLAHATMEPMNATADVRPGRCEIWAPTQGPQRARRVAARRLGLSEDAVTVHVTYLGGGFGRKGSTDAVEEAVDISREIGAPVQVVWSREDDMRHGDYRPATYNVLRAALRADGVPVAWHHRLAAPAGGGWMITRGADDIRYAIPNLRVDRVVSDPGIPVTAWRGVGPSQNGCVVESFVDEVAHAAGTDPYAFRRRMLASQPRHLAVLDLAAERAGWTRPAPAGRHRGIAIVDFGGTVVAEVAEVSVREGNVRVHRVVCAVDCGVVVNPDIVEAQMEGAVVYGLSAALHGEITIERGRVVQGNFNDYPVVQMPAMPSVETHFVRSDRAPTGIGEPGLPPIAPAVCNAIFAGTGTRIRKLPIRLG